MDEAMEDELYEQDTPPKPVMMRCGCVSTGIRHRQDGAPMPVCIAHYGIKAGAVHVDESYVTTIGRQSRCPYCRQLATSDPSLAFFQARPQHQFDSHYDGCRGWD